VDKQSFLIGHWCDDRGVEYVANHQSGSLKNRERDS